MDTKIDLPPPEPISITPRRPTREEAEAAVRTLIAWAGDDPDRPGVLETPKRVVNAYGEFFRGYGETPESVLDQVFDEAGGYDDMLLVRDIPFYSHCEHHLVPFIGKAHVAYYPQGGVVGLSKLVRVVETFARRLQMQERLTRQIADAVDAALAPRGVAVMLEAEHHCVSMRGVQKAGVSTVTTSFTGLFQSDPAERDRFFERIAHR